VLCAALGMAVQGDMVCRTNHRHAVRPDVHVWIVREALSRSAAATAASRRGLILVVLLSVGRRAAIRPGLLAHRCRPWEYLLISPWMIVRYLRLAVLASATSCSTTASRRT